MKDDFPEIKQARDIETTVSAEPNGTQVVETDRTQFISPDGKSVVQVSPFRLTVNQLAPYPTWKEFYPFIKRSLNEYVEVANPGHLLGVQLQYRNKIVFPKATVRVEDYFNYYYMMPDDLGGSDALADGFLLGVQMPSSDGSSRLKLQIADSPVEVLGTTAITLQLSYEVAIPGSVSLHDVDNWLTEAHKQVEVAFEGSIKDSLREMFGEVKNAGE